MPASTPIFKHVPQDYAPPGYMTSQEFAAIRGVSDETPRSERARGRSPVPWSLFMGRKPVYRRQDVDAYLRREAEKAQARAATLLARAAEHDAPESSP